MPFGDESDPGWPELEDLKRRLNVVDESTHDVEIGVILAAAIAQIKLEVGDWDELVDAPNEAMAESALQRGFEMGSADEAGLTRGGNAHIPKSNQLLLGQRRRFPIG